MTNAYPSQLRRVHWDSPLGPINFWAWGEHIVRLDFPGHNDTIADRWSQRHFGVQPILGAPTDPPFDAAISQLSDYFAGRLCSFALPVAYYGTPFQRAVWEAVSRIPWGVTRTYQQIAVEIGHPAAVRAVGSANGANPLSIIVPCHRLIGSDGALRGYGGGLDRKEQLLALEGVVRNAAPALMMDDGRREQP